jgi:ATP-dependent Clp protease ATP-binding subunit ClpC
MREPDESLGRLAEAEAAALGEEHVGTHHLLLAVANSTGTVAATALATNGVHLQQLRALLARGVLDAQPAVLRNRPWTPRAKWIVKLAIDEAKALGHDYIGPEHVLLAVLRDEDGTGCQAVHKLNVDLAAIRRAVLEGLEQV